MLPPAFLPPSHASHSTAWLCGSATPRKQYSRVAIFWRRALTSWVRVALHQKWRGQLLWDEAALTSSHQACACSSGLPLCDQAALNVAAGTPDRALQPSSNAAGMHFLPTEGAAKACRQSSFSEKGGQAFVPKPPTEAGYRWPCNCPAKLAVKHSRCSSYRVSHVWRGHLGCQLGTAQALRLGVCVASTEFFLCLREGRALLLSLPSGQPLAVLDMPHALPMQHCWGLGAASCLAWCAPGAILWHKPVEHRLAVLLSLLVYVVVVRGNRAVRFAAARFHRAGGCLRYWAWRTCQCCPAALL